MTSWQDFIDHHKAQYVTELSDFLRIPSVSSLSEHAEDVKQAAEWVADRLRKAGMEAVAVMPTGGHPVVGGQWLHAPDKPTVLIYGHFDVQPADPLELWTTPPFEPEIRDDRIYARGASDNKGNMLIPIIAVEAILQSDGSLPVNVKFLFEGQEEIGSPQLAKFLKNNRDLFACDLILNADSGQWSEDQPSLLTSLRGLCGLQVDVTGADTDLHSGMYGGAVQNPIHALVQILNSMRGLDGRILIEGFYDEVRELSDAEKTQIGSLPFDEAEFMDRVGVTELYGEPGFSNPERIWTRPTLELNGIWGGFQGEGLKTVLPNKAHAKITCRLVADQDPKHINSLIETHIRKNTPPGVKVEITPVDSNANPYLMPADLPGSLAAIEILTELYGKKPLLIREGGSVPILSLLLKHLGAYATCFGFGMNDEKFHAPDEFFRLKSFELGQRAYCKILYRLGEQT
ncbi:MAG: dipeptidase [Desulfobacterales bacterium]|jgi:acetylornithine deacetylase/succinyl-diaminopimelate desuccinylase-like protein